MNKPQPDCPNCRIEMQQGHVLARGYLIPPIATHWVAGLPKERPRVARRADADEKIPIVSYRCPQCGLLQDYAR
jgi:predicted RNA-binding Zn-ribbon protein involved in translation (DUF1610 family)